jgi:thiamine biosynthesis lipoprotein
LGGIGKGWTLDQVASGLVDQGVMDFAFHGGMSSVVARGQAASAITRPPTDSSVAESSETNAGADPGQPGWLIGVADPFYPDRRLGYLNLRNRALGTSGSARQFIHYRGRRLSHILDPRTGLPAEGVLSATVLAPTATQADALGTACFVLGVEGCQALVEVCPDLGILLVVPDGRTCRVVAMGAIDASWLPREESFAARSN